MAEHVVRSLSEPFFAPSVRASPTSLPAISRVSTPPPTAADEESVAKEDEEASEPIQRMADPWFSDGAGDDENTAASPSIQRRAVCPPQGSRAFGALPISYFAARPLTDSRKGLKPARATISSGWVSRTPVRSRPDRARGPPRGEERFTTLLSQSKGRGQPLSQQSRAEMEPAFDADFGIVRVHTGDEAHRLTNRASAVAFAHEGDIYFNRGQFQPDTVPGRSLLAHELTHVVQQGSAVQRNSIQRLPFSPSITQRSNHARAPPQISSAEPQIQRLGWSDIKEEINSYAELIHGFTLMTVVVGYNPILDQDVEWTAKNFFRGAAGLIPFGTLIFDKLDEAGVIDSVFSWVTSQIDAHNLSLARVNSLFSQAWDQMDFVRLDPVDYNVEVVRSTFSGLLSDVADFASACADKLVEVFKDLAIKAVRAIFGENAPSYDLICQVLGQDPLTGEAKEWNTADFLRSVLLLFGFENHLAKMEETGQVEKAAAWIDAQVGLLISAYSGLIFGVIDLWTSLSLEKLIHPEELLADTLSIVLTYVGKLALFAFNLGSRVLELIKEALITLLKAHVHKVPGYSLFTVVLGMDPVTGEEVPRTPENFLKGFLSFIPKGIETYENIKASGALPKAMAWLLGLINELGLSPSQLLERFLTLWNSFSIDDLMNPIGAYIRIAETYLSFVRDVLMLVLRVYWKVLEIMFVFLLGPGAARVVAALKQGEDTFRLIIEDPVGFFGNLLSAIGKGIKQFGSNIWKHIQGGLIGWMLGSLQGAGIEMPEKFDLQGVVSIVMQLLGLTYRQIRPILVKRLGENVVSDLEKAFEFLRLFLTEGFAGVWRQFLEWVGDLKGIVIQAVTEWVVTKIVMAGLSRLATLWNPVGWAVEAVMAIYNTVMFFIERMEQILDFVEAVIQSINNIATGKLQQAADYVESAMARTIPVIISFCTSLIGLGGISSKIRGVIQKVQDKVHKAIDTMIAWIVTQAKKLVKTAVKTEEQEGLDLAPEQALNEVKRRVDASAAELVGKTNEEAAVVMQGLYERESEWVKKNVKSVGKAPTLLLIPRNSEESWWIDVQINPVVRSTAVPKVPKHEKGTAGEWKEKGLIGMFHGSHHVIASAADIDPARLLGADDGKGLELGSGLYLAHYYQDVKGYVDPVSSRNDADNIGNMHRIMVPKLALQAATTVHDPDPSAGDPHWSLQGDVVKGEWLTLGGKDWRAGYQWCIKPGALTPRAEDEPARVPLTIAEVLKPLQAADDWGRGRTKEYPTLFGVGGAAKPPLTEGKKLAEIGSRRGHGERPKPQTAPVERKAKETNSFTHSCSPTPYLESALKARKGDGAPIGSFFRHPMELAFGRNLSLVRIHTGAEAAGLARSLDARAFTHGSEIYFDAGEYDPQSRRGRQLLAHELTHVVQQTRPGATPFVQRQADPAHDLTASGLSGDPKLEEVFDEKGFLGPPRKGPEVKKVQEALLALGFTLPKFGADGDYGSETRQAVRDFQAKAGLSGTQIDGIVGPITLGLLDRASRQGSVTADTDAAEQDLKVTGKATSKLEDHLNKDGTPKEPVRVFFEFDSDKVASDEKDKLKALHEKFPTQTLTLKGLASEEGSASHNAALADQRREAVTTILRDEHKHDASLLADHKSEVAKGNIEYKEMRAVDVAIGGTAFERESIVDTKTKADATCTAEESKKVTEAVQKAVPEGVKWIVDVRKELPPTKQATTDLFDKLFGVRATDPKARGTERDSAVRKVNGILDKLSPHLDNTKRPCATDADLETGGCHVCRNEQDGGCASGSPAYNVDSAQGAGITRVCTSFVGESFDEQATILIHEGHHGTPDIPSSDLAYSHTRLITAVSTSSALENATSFHLYIRLVKSPGSEEVGHEKTPDLQVGLSDDEFATMQTLLGLLEQWFSLSTFDLSNLYSAIRRARTFGDWQSEDETIRFAGMGRVAPRFGLTPPEFLPIKRDQTGLAAIYDRFRTMERGVKQQLTIEKTAAGPSAWDRGPGKSLKLPLAFFAEPRNKQMTWLLQELVSATPDISAALEPRYVALIDDLRLARNLPLNP